MLFGKKKKPPITVCITYEYAYILNLYDFVFLVDMYSPNKLGPKYETYKISLKLSRVIFSKLP